MSNIKRNFVYNTLYQLLAIFLPLVTAPYLARVIGAEGTGIYQYYFSISKYFVLFSMMGINNYGNRTIARIRDDKELLAKTFTSIYILQVSLHLITILLYCIYCAFVLKNSMAFLLTIYVISSLFDINWFFFGMEEFRITVIRNAVIKLLSVACILIFVKASTDVWKYGLIMVSSFLLSQMSLWPFVRKFTRFTRVTFSEVVSHLKPNLILFIPVIAVSLYKTMDKVMLGAMTTYKQVGFYDNCESLISIPMVIVQSLGTVMLPKMSNLFAFRNGMDIGKRYIHYSVVFVVFLAGSISFGIMSVSKEFVPLFYGPGFEQCITILLVLCPSCIFTGIANVIRTQFLIPQKRDKEYIFSVSLGAVVNLIINYILIPKYSAFGAAIGTLVAEGVVCVYQVITVRKEIHLKSIMEDSLPLLFTSIAMFLILYNINGIFDNKLLNVFLKVVIGVVLYIVIGVLCILMRNRIVKNRLFLKE